MIIYFSQHNHSKQVAESLELFPIWNIEKDSLNFDGNFFVFICPTYGDEELPLPMEDFLINLSVTNKSYTICELGNYYGYDDPTFGAAKIIRSELKSKNWKEVFPCLSLDSLPVIDWESLYPWKTELHKFINEF